MFDLADLKKMLEIERGELIRAMIVANQPVENQLAEIKRAVEVLKDKGVEYLIRLERNEGYIKRNRSDILKLERQVYNRRKTDQSEADDDDGTHEHDEGERRRITMFDVYVAIGTATATYLVLKAFGVVK